VGGDSGGDIGVTVVVVTVVVWCVCGRRGGRGTVGSACISHTTLPEIPLNPTLVPGSTKVSEKTSQDPFSSTEPRAHL
jgi:hypothetical protein